MRVDVCVVGKCINSEADWICMLSDTVGDSIVSQSISSEGRLLIIDSQCSRVVIKGRLNVSWKQNIDLHLLFQILATADNPTL